MPKNIVPFLTALALMLGSSAGHAGLIVVSGDVTPSFYLTDSPPDTAIAGNGQFFQNVLGAGSSVAVLDTVDTGADNEIDEFFDSLAGVTSNLFSGAVTPTILAGADLLMLPSPSDDFTAAELTAILDFFTGGGSVFLLAEPVLNPGPQARVNSVLTALGSSMSVDGSQIDSGAQVASGAQILGNALTAGVTSFGYGATSVVSGGTALILSSDATGNQTFVAFEGQAVPEPQPLALVLAGLAFATVATARRHSRRVH